MTWVEAAGRDSVRGMEVTPSSPGRRSLRTERLLLRDFAPDDVERVHAYASDPVVTRLTDWGPNTIEETRSFIRESVLEAGESDRRSFTLAAVVEEDDALVGTVAIWVEDAGHRRGALGAVFHPSVWNRGYATEAFRELIRFGFEELRLERIAATCHPGNAGSVGALTRAGLRAEGRLRSHLQTRHGRRDSLLFAILPTDPR
ncbi:Protein N-acetyltransferase, RimJ/RimL family [Actinoplanes regularis]|uniref:Protein N-acetyltransferase, RimJ/RimL family n=2 Tax=Actinoplanes regularis TaxID=52697 RepID=A0A239DVU7_9ACTN|nr:Protein N-acetyltransferase, RimJ/RimL family [Actinoplanes regularis]